MYQTIKQDTTFEIIEKKSKFIANLFFVQNKDEAENKIKEVKKKFYDARHNCFAFRIIEKEGVYEKASDDGEPAGTAGSPMLGALQKNNMCNVLVVVTRYFGGILLGTGGLVRCYLGATIGAIEKADMANLELGTKFKVQVDYANFKNLQYYCQKNGIAILECNYDENVTCLLVVSSRAKQNFLANLDMVSNIEELQTRYYQM